MVSRCQQENLPDLWFMSHQPGLIVHNVLDSFSLASGLPGSPFPWVNQTQGCSCPPPLSKDMILCLNFSSLILCRLFDCKSQLVVCLTALTRRLGPQACSLPRFQLKYCTSDVRDLKILHISTPSFYIWEHWALERVNERPVSHSTEASIRIQVPSFQAQCFSIIIGNTTSDLRGGASHPE